MKHLLHYKICLKIGCVFITFTGHILISNNHRNLKKTILVPRRTEYVKIFSSVLYTWTFKLKSTACPCHINQPAVWCC